MELLLIIILGLLCSSSIRSAKARIFRLENELSNLKLELKLKKPSTSSIDDTIISPLEVQKNSVSKVDEPIQQPVTQPLYARAETIETPSINAIVAEDAPVKPSDTKPTFDSELFLPEWVMRSLTGGRLFVTLGLLILFIGVALLLKYTAQYVVIPIELRFIGVAVGAVGLMAFGHKQINTRRDYGLYLFGGGLGILFLTVFTAFKFYALLSPSMAFILLGGIGLATFSFAIIYDTMALAVLAITGGFLAPILASTGQGSHIGLFSYYLLLNLIIFAIAWKKSWRILNNIGFAFTFIIGLLWGGKYYIPEFYQSVQAFLIIYFLLYVGIGILFASRSKPNISVPIDAASIFGVPLIGFGLQLALSKYFPNGHTISCLALGVFYSILSTVLRYSVRDGWKLLSQIFAWLSVLFFTLAIPFAFDAQTTAPLWAIEGVTMLWMLGRSKQKIYGYAGVLLIAISNIFVLQIVNTQGIGTPFANGFFLSAIILAIAHFLAAHFLNPKRSTLEDTESLASIFSLVGMGWWFGVGGREIQYALTSDNVLVAWLVFYALSALSSMIIYARFKVALFDKPITLLLPAIIGFSVLKILDTSRDYHPLMEYGYIAYAISFAVHYYWLWKNREQELGWAQVMAYITLTLLCSFEIGYYTNMLEPAMVGKISGWLLATVLGIALLVLPNQYRKWPITTICEKYQQKIAVPLIVWAVILCLRSFTNISALYGHYIPLFNLVDMVEILTIFSLAMFYKKATIQNDLKNNLAIASSGLAFLFINALMLRFTSEYLHLPYLSNRMFDSVIVQTSLTILWTLMAMATMLTSSKNSYRNAWFVGAALLGIVVLKLFFIDLDGVGTISRIVSFMGVGLLTISLGYFSPIPTKK